jgi:two-component system, sensor histidine kinase and response regulator
MASDRPSVLIVDDVEANLVSLDALLASLDCEVVRASSGNEALKHVLRREFAVILLDVQMPQMDGYEVARYVREHPSSRDTPIIFLTALNPSQENLLRGYAAGAVDYIFKPVDATVLKSKVSVFLELYGSRRRLADALAELERANAALRQFTTAASHDLREPARTIRGFLRALSTRHGARLEPEAQRFIDRSIAASQRMLSLLDALLVYARLQKRPVFAPVDCQALVEQVRSDLSERLAGSGGSVVIRDALPRVLADPDRLYQLFLNLVTNGLKFARPGHPPRVEISTTVSGGQCLFCVEDDGIGIPRRFQEAIFDPFRRLHGHAEYEGSGLGLTICKEIIEQHGGRLWVESEEGKGSRFLFSIETGLAAPAEDRPVQGPP